MTQQINLLPRVQRNYAAAAAVAGVAVALLAGGAYISSSNEEMTRLRDSEKQARGRTESMNAELMKLQGSDGGAGLAKLTAEVTAMRARTDGMREFLKQVDSGALGNPGGYPALFKALALSADENVWVTNFTVTQSGKTVSISGGASSNEAVLDFARRAKQRLGEAGVTVRALEIRPPAEQSGAAGFVSFKLS
jgi:Tfp pilus assembly protein PilN